MTLKVDDHAVITGPLKMAEYPVDNSHIRLMPSEIVRVLDDPDSDGDVFVLGLTSGFEDHIDSRSLTALDEYDEAPDFDYSAVRDFVWTGDDE